MRKITLSLFILLTVTTGIFAGGVVTNTNQSAMYVRILARDASTDIDAVYYNPASLALLADGFYISVNNQVIGKTNKVTNDYYLLHQGSYNGDIMAPVFPGIYAAYKRGKFAYSIGFNPIAGGGGAEYANGVAGTEIAIAAMIPGLASESGFAGLDDVAAAIFSNDETNYGSISDYRYKTQTAEGKEVRFGIQGGLSYKFNDFFSGFVGGRYVIAPGSMNTVKMELTGIEFKSDYKNAWYAPDAYLQQFNTDMGTEYFEQEDIDGYKIKDVYTDVSFSGTGFTPIVGLNLQVSEKMNVGIKYEHLTRMILTTKVNNGKDGDETYTDGKETRADLPPLFTVGVNYEVMDGLTVSGSFRHYWDFDSDYGFENIEGQRKFITKNTWEAALGAEYKVMDNLVVSAGYQRTQFSPSQYYQNSTRNLLSSNTVGFGGTYGVSESLSLTLGIGFTMYSDYTRAYDGNGITQYYNPGRIFAVETYDKSAWMVGIGANYILGNSGATTTEPSLDE